MRASAGKIGSDVNGIGWCAGWCDQLGIALVILDPSTWRPMPASPPRGLDDARLRRARARAGDSELGLANARALLAAKLWSQARVLTRLDALDAIEDVVILVLDHGRELTDLRDLRHPDAFAAAARDCGR